MRFNTAENFSQTARYVGATVTAAQQETIRAYTVAFVDSRKLLFAERAATETLAS